MPNETNQKERNLLAGEIQVSPTAASREVGRYTDEAGQEHVVLDVTSDITKATAINPGMDTSHIKDAHFIPRITNPKVTGPRPLRHVPQDGHHPDVEDTAAWAEALKLRSQQLRRRAA
ncbi:hypothetical protein HY388_00360 [Candidatus Daviesbacteria bacterium]|nr:hypothetical protein [Candidatus Daviesbacteria bacterium]